MYSFRDMQLQAIKDFRTHHKLSRAALGERIGVDAMTIRRWENGESLPRRAHWDKIKEETGVGLDVQVTQESDIGPGAG